MRSILNEGVVVNVNSLSNGNGIEIVSTASTQSTANVNFKMNTSEQTTPNSNDWILIADNATGKIIKRMLYSNIIGGVEYTGTSPVSVNNTTNTISIDTIPVDKGGTNQTSYTDGQLLIGNTSGNTLTKATLTAGSGISITNGNGSISIGATSLGQWTLNSGLLYPISALTKVAIGGTTINTGFEFQNHGNFYNTGNITTVSFESGAVVLRDVNNSGIRFDYYNGSSYDVGPLIKPDIIGTKEYIHINTSFMTGAINAGERMVIQSYLHNGANTTIEVQSQTSANTIKLPTTTGTLALTTDIIQSNWTLSSSLLYPNATGTNVLIGKTTSAKSAKLEVEGNQYINGTLEMNNTQISKISQLLINDASNNNYYTFKGAELDTNIITTLPEIAGQLLVPNSTATLGSGYTWNGVEIEADKLKIGLQLLDDNTIDYETSDNLIALKRSNNEAIRLYGNVSSNDSSARIEFYKRPTSSTESFAATIGFFEPINSFNISPLGLRVVNGSTHMSTSVPTNGYCSLYVDTPVDTTSANKYVSKVRYNMSGDTTANFTSWVYNDTSSTRQFYGFSYWSGTGTGLDIYSLERDGDMNILGNLSESDSRVKCNIEDANLDECIDVLKSINLKKYNYTDDYIYSYNKTTQKVFGFLADDIIDNEYLGYCGKVKGMPKILNKANGETETLNDFKTIRKSEILSVLWGCCNKFAIENEDLKSRVETLEEEIENIKILLINNNII